MAECPLVLRLPSCRWATSWRSTLWTPSWPRWWWLLRSSGGTARLTPLRPSQLNPAAVSLFANVLILSSRRANSRAKYKRTYHMSTNSSARGGLQRVCHCVLLQGLLASTPMCTVGCWLSEYCKDYWKESYTVHSLMKHADGCWCVASREARTSAPFVHRDWVLLIGAKSLQCNLFSMQVVACALPLGRAPVCQSANTPFCGSA